MVNILECKNDNIEISAEKNEQAFWYSTNDFRIYMVRILNISTIGTKQITLEIIKEVDDFGITKFPRYSTGSRVNTSYFLFSRDFSKDFELLASQRLFSFLEGQRFELQQVLIMKSKLDLILENRPELFLRYYGKLDDKIKGAFNRKR